MSSRIDDPIVEEVRRVRAELFARHGNDIAALVRHAQEFARTLGRPCVRYPPRPAVRPGGEPAATEARGYSPPPVAKVVRPAPSPRPPRSAPKEAS